MSKLTSGTSSPFLDSIQSRTLPVLNVQPRWNLTGYKDLPLVVVTLPKGTILWECLSHRLHRGLGKGALLSSLEAAIDRLPDGEVPKLIMSEAHTDGNIVAFQVTEDIHLVDLSVPQTLDNLAVLQRHVLPKLTAETHAPFMTGIAVIAQFIGSPLFLSLLTTISASAFIASHRDESHDHARSIEAHGVRVPHHHLLESSTSASMKEGITGQVEGGTSISESPLHAGKPRSGPAGSGQGSQEPEHLLSPEEGVLVLKRTLSDIDTVINRVVCDLPQEYMAHGWASRGRVPATDSSPHVTGALRTQQKGGAPGTLEHKDGTGVSGGVNDVLLDLTSDQHGKESEPVYESESGKEQDGERFAYDEVYICDKVMSDPSADLLVPIFPEKDMTKVELDALEAKVRSLTPSS